MNFSKELIAEYLEEMYSTYGVFFNDDDAQVHLASLVSGMFPDVQEGGVLSDASASTHTSFEVGASITPTSGQKDKENG